MLSRWVDDALEETEAANAQAKAPAAVKSVKVEGQKSPVFMAASAAATIPRETGDIPARQPSMLEADEEGCVGGSMAHTHEEGESRKEHARHVREARKQEAQEALAVQAATELSEMNLHRLRQAVVMAEILDRPRALRRAR